MIAGGAYAYMEDSEALGTKDQLQIRRFRGS